MFQGLCRYALSVVLVPVSAVSGSLPCVVVQPHVVVARVRAVRGAVRARSVIAVRVPVVPCLPVVVVP